MARRARTTRLPTFQEVLSEAIADMIEHGFDTMERVERWKRELLLAAERSLASPAKMEEMMREGLAAIYRRMVDEGDIFKTNTGVARFTLEKVKPALRGELDRRIAASANLIKLNREQAIAKTLQRFEGWSTSIPPGGVSAEKRSELKKSIPKSLGSLKFEERRVLIDQGHKMAASLSEILATDGGAIACRWRSNWRQAGYDYRKDHKERDDKIYLVRDSWAHKAGLVRKGGRPFFDEITAPGQEVSCRCYVQWIYNIRDLPADMLTKAGQAKLDEVRARIASGNFARTDAADTPSGGFDAEVVVALQTMPVLLRAAAAADRLGFRRGLRRIDILSDTDQWHASTDRGVIQLEAKFFDLPAGERLQTFMHELGHVGQDIDPGLYRAFVRRHGDDLTSFLRMANLIHRQAYSAAGNVEGGIAAELFAESYARAMLALPLPETLAAFWRTQATGLRTQRDAKYGPWWPNKITRCARCTMFVPGVSPSHNFCTAVEGDIALHGHCELFEIVGARTDTVEPDPGPAIGARATRMRLERLRSEV